MWDDIVEFPAVEELEIWELQPGVRMNVEDLGQLARALRDEQQVLESDKLASGSHFIGVLSSISYPNAKFVNQPATVGQFEQQVLDFTVGYRTESPAFPLMAFLHSSVQFIVGRTYSSEE
jgi:hypothetical protein